MSDVNKWMLSICAVVIMGVVADLFLDGTKMGKFVRCAFASVTILVMVSPILGVVDGYELSFTLKESAIEIDESYIDFVRRQKELLIAKTIEEQLKTEGVDGANITIVLENDDGEEIIKLVEINLSQSVIDEKYEHINRNELIVELLSKFIKVPNERISIYG